MESHSFNLTTTFFDIEITPHKTVQLINHVDKNWKYLLNYAKQRMLSYEI